MPRTNTTALILLPIVAVAASAVTLAIVVAPSMGAEILAGLIVARILLGVARWGYVLFLGRVHLREGLHRLGAAGVPA